MPAHPSAVLPDALQRLYRRTRHGIRPGLERTQALLARLGDPHRELLAVHVAGTNGKGSVCAMIESVLRAAGLRTGLYTSPHLVRFNERFRVAGRPIPDEELAPLIAEMESEADAVETEPGGPGACTFFEMATAIAFAYFQRSGIQAAVLETGMGGRWDATNVVHPLVSVITDIGLDHAEFLGPTLAAIAGEKAGIIKPGRPVVCGVEAQEAVPVVVETARNRNARLIRVSETVAVRRKTEGWSGQHLSVETPTRAFSTHLPLLGEHQARNTAIAVTALETFESETGLSIPDSAFEQGLSTVAWPARLQRLESAPPVMLDGAHNPHAAKALARTLRALAGPRRVFLVAGMLADKDAAGLAAALAPEVRSCWTVPIPFERGRDASDLAAAFRAAGLDARPAVDVDAALIEAKAGAVAHDGVVCIAGSLYLAAAVLCRYGGERLFEGGAA